MKIYATIKPASKKEAVAEIDATHFIVRTTAPAREGKANAAVIEALARHLGIAKSRIRIAAGAKSK